MRPHPSASIGIHPHSRALIRVGRHSSFISTQGKFIQSKIEMA